MKTKILYLFLFVFFFGLFPNIYGEGKNTNDSLIINFEPGEFEVSDKELDTLIEKLNKSKKYRIQGYSCKKDKDTNVDRIAIAEKRAEKIANLLLDHGFSNKNITTIAYDESTECKAIIIDVGDNKP